MPTIADLPTPDDAAIGKRITAARQAKGWSLQYVADRLKVSKATVGHWETGARAIKHGDLAALCLLLQTSADMILFGRRQWPFKNITLEAVAALEAADVAQLEGAMRLMAAQAGIDLGAAPLGGAIAATVERGPTRNLAA